MLEGLQIADLAPATLLGLCVLLILLGRLVPRATYKDKSEEAERWRLAYELEKDARQVSDTQTLELLELAKTTHALISAIVRTTGVSVNVQSGGTDVVQISPPETR